MFSYEVMYEKATVRMPALHLNCWHPRNSFIGANMWKCLGAMSGLFGKCANKFQLSNSNVQVVFIKDSVYSSHK